MNKSAMGMLLTYLVGVVLVIVAVVSALYTVITGGHVPDDLMVQSIIAIVGICCWGYAHDVGHIRL